MITVDITGKNPVRPFQLTQQDKDQLDKFNDRWDQLELPRLIHKYRVGQFVARHLEAYQGRNKDVLERIAERLPHHPSTLRTWMTVPVAFSENEFHALIHRKTARGNRLFWTHLVLAARVSDPTVRERFIEEVFEHDLRTTELRERIRPWVERWSLDSDPVPADRIETVPFQRDADSYAGPFAEAV